MHTVRAKMADIVRRPEEGVEALDSQELFPAGAAAASGAFAPGTEPHLGEQFEGGEAQTNGSVFRLTLGTFLENKLALVGLGMLVLLALFSFVGPHLYVTDQLTLNPAISNYGPSAGHLLGTDGEGFDI